MASASSKAAIPVQNGGQSVNNHTEEPRASFLGLPKEIRLEIYDWVFYSTTLFADDLDSFPVTQAHEVNDEGVDVGAHVVASARANARSDEGIDEEADAVGEKEGDGGRRGGDERVDEGSEEMGEEIGAEVSSEGGREVKDE